MFVTGYWGFTISDVSQFRADMTRIGVQSVRVEDAKDPITRVRLFSTQIDYVNLQLSADGGLNWQGVGSNWMDLSHPGTDLRWKGYMQLQAPYQTSPLPELSHLQVEWLFEHPVIQSIADVGNDQGRWVRLRFSKASRDMPEETAAPVTGYQVYHRVDGATAASRVAGHTYVQGGPTLDGGTFPPGTWEAVTYVAATQSPTYSVLLPTTADSTASGVQWSAFLVTAHTTVPTTWYVSRADSGYSIDNLAPHAPDELIANYDGTGVQLDWSATIDPDFQYFKLYRSTKPGFTPGPATLLHTTTGLSWRDAGAPHGNVYYAVTAVDFAGNESGAAYSTTTAAVGDAPLPLRFALRGSAPNPFRTTTLVRYDVPAPGGRVYLRLFDVSGRLVRTLIDGAQAPGTRSATWDGRDDAGRVLPAGLYLARMEAAGYERTSRLVLAR
jgi:hypothetical protein